MSKILVVEDDKSLGQMVCRWMRSQQHVVDLVENGDEALELLRAYAYDLVVLDITLPGKDGFSICHEYRASGGHAPVLMLTGKQAIADKEQGLDAGADDYLTKPFDIRELGARVRALLRRRGSIAPQCLMLGDLELDLRGVCVRKRGVKLELASKEFALLEFFMRNPNQVFAADVLLDRVWKASSDSTVASVRVYINRLRSQLGKSPGCPYIETLHGVGYKLVFEQTS